jgi:TPR repeat protein
MSLDLDIDCPICLDRLPFNRKHCSLMHCCGNWIHEHCSEGADAWADETCGATPSIVDNCPFCRAPRVAENSPEMLRRIRKWADADKMWAHYQLGYFYLNGDGGVDLNITTALKYLEIAANGGYRAALTCLGRLYEKGEVVEQSYTRSKTYYEKSASQGDDFAQLALAKMYINGFGGVVKNSTEANRYLQLSADQNNSYACFTLALKILAGDNIRMSTFRAKHYLAKVNPKEVPPTLQGMTSTYMKELVALMVSQRGAAKGIARHQFNLASGYANSQVGVGKSLPAAAFWYAKAVAQGFGHAIPCLAMLTTMIEQSQEEMLPEDSLFCSTCASLTPKRVLPIKRPGFLRCTCKTVVFCSKECQKEGWKGHVKAHKIAVAAAVVEN